MDITPFTNKINMMVGLIVSILAYVFGKNWFLFVAFLFLNSLDYLSRWLAARITGTESSRKGWIGVLKKIGYWLMILFGFGMSAIFIEIGEVIGINLGVTTLLGWFVLATLSVNECRSILENFVDGGFPVPKFLVKGLEAANKVIETVTEKEEAESEESQENLILK